MMYRLDKEWYGYVNTILADPESAEADQARADLKNSLLSVAKTFASSPYFLSDDFSLIDCVVAPLLWRLPMLGIQLPPAKGKEIHAYMDKVFARDSFQASLTEKERELR